jgi:hypothetical protein
MENIPIFFMTIQIIMFPLSFFKHTKMNFFLNVQSFEWPFDCVFSLMLVNKKSLGQNIYNHIFVLQYTNLSIFLFFLTPNDDES